MAKKFYETDEFKKMNKQWYAKLKEEGFQDIESASDIESNSITKQHITVDHQRISYNKSCQQYLAVTNFPDKLDAFIFQSHCDGISNHKISESLVANGFKAMTPRGVDKRLLRILSDAGIKPINYNV